LEKKTRKQLLFQVLNEIGIIQQLATTEFNRRLPEGLHVSHFSVINHLCRLGDGRTPLRLARAFQVTKATMTNTLTRLSARGLIEIRDNPADGRSKLVFLTSKGRAFQKRAIAALEPVLELMDRNLDLEKIIQMRPTLQELREFLDSNRSA
jgi:DNA-binding MarR family transcriptional regulator